MYDSLMQAFSSGQPQTQSFDFEAERRKLTAEVLAESITKDHPKVKDIVAEACSQMQEKMHL